MTARSAELESRKGEETSTTPKNERSVSRWRTQTIAAIAQATEEGQQPCSRS